MRKQDQDSSKGNPGEQFETRTIQINKRKEKKRKEN